MRLADDDQLTAQLQFKRTREAMAKGRPPLSPSTLRGELQQVGLRENLLRPRYSRHAPEDLQQRSRSQVLLPITRSPIIGGDHESSIFDPARQLDGLVAANAIHPVVEISPREAVARLTLTGHGMAAESVQSTSRSAIQHHYRAPMHMLVMYEKGERRDGETFVEGLPRSALRNLERKLTFVPAGREFHDWHEPRGSQMRLMYFYFEPEKLKALSKHGITDLTDAPRLLFEDETLWHTAFKLKTFVESSAGDPMYFGSLGTLLIHEVVRFTCGMPSIQPQLKGGLAPWQQRIVTAYIEEHLNERIPIGALAQLVRLSPFHFCRVFKQSLGMPPHRYQTSRRVEHAKLLLANRAGSMTEIGLAVGFSSRSAFATAFRKATGIAPADYRRSVAPPVKYE
ncbi:helix-turn-helix domain-containing protein [Bradyrhizobium liaoningense]|uniref:helix-turn-helix domain-containing protein n=1 Tax=Bradyrhizobium liaoningense TaxID=43992 RepID=UPI001BA7472A|nr:AraC family transcriptional regulator [Bradyrhizobium liaoningense]MBR0823832.1 helix-turn-helix transcriptional regulator [Bradyrhizobium liaoningense]